SVLMCIRLDGLGGAALDIEASQTGDQFRLRRIALDTTLLPRYMGDECDIAPVVSPRVEGKVEGATSGCRIPWHQDREDIALFVRLEDSLSQSNVVLVRQVDALVGRHNADKEKGSSIVETGAEGYLCKRPTPRRRSDPGREDRCHSAGV